MTTKPTIESFEKILIQNPRDEKALFGLAMTFYSQGEFRKAKSVLQKLLQHAANHAQAHCNLAAIHWRLREFDEGLLHAQKAIQLKPDFALAYRNAGLLYLEKGKLDQAHVFLSKAVKLDDKNPEAHCSLGRFYFVSKNYSEALKCFQNALFIQPDWTTAFLEIGNTYKAAGQYDDAIQAYKTALQLKPNDVFILNNLATAFQDLDEYEAAKESYQAALNIDPKNAVVLCNFAQLEEEAGHLTEATRLVKASLQNDPHLIDAHLTQSLIHFKNGDYAKAWDESEWRLQKSEYDYLKYYVQPLWEEQDLQDKTLLVHAEQGLGDELTFYSCLPDVLTLTSRYIVECDPRLVALLQNSFPTLKILPRPKDNILHSLCISDNKIDYQIPSGSLLKIFRRKHSDFPKPGGFLKAEEVLRTKWKSRLQALSPGLKVGISWTSSLNQSFLDSSRRSKGSTALSQWRKILTLPGIQFINLQYGDVQDEIKACQQQFPFVLHQWPDLDLKNDLSDVAALITELDLVISVNTAVSILAASLGQVTWTLCDFANTYPEQVESPDVFIPDRLMIRQNKAGEWLEVFNLIFKKLQDQLKS